MTVPPNTLASLSIWFTVWLSAKYDRRAPFIIGAASVAILGVFSSDGLFTQVILKGYIILLATKTGLLVCVF